MKAKIEDSVKLTKHQSGSLRELSALAFPLIFTMISTSLLTLCDRFFLSHYSMQAFHACAAASDLAFLFQMFCIMIVMIGQVFIGEYQGANEKHKIGPLVWQLIFFSFISMMLSYPISLVAESYFYHTEIEAPALTYFRILSFCNFLFPLGAALSTFFIGRGKTKTILFATLFTHVLNIILDYLLIFGAGEYIPSMGAKGAAIATVFSQGALCLILYFLFKKRKHREIYRTDDRSLRPALLKKVLITGLPRATGRAIMITTWNAAAYILLVKGGDHLLVRTFGTSLFIILSFIIQGMGQAFLTISAHLIGAKEDEKIKGLLKNAFIFLGGILAVLALPLFVFSDYVIDLFINEPLSHASYATLRICSYAMWFMVLANGINCLGTFLITAYKDTFFYLLCVPLLWVTLFIPAHYGIGTLGWHPITFFLLDGASCILLGLIFFQRVKSRHWARHEVAPSV